MKRWGWLLGLALAGCATEAERACAAIEATGVADTPTNYAACDPARGRVCGAWECGRPFASPVGQCARPCARDQECWGSAGVSRDTYCHEGHCLLNCRYGAECPSGTTCRARSFRGGNAELCLPVDCSP